MNKENVRVIREKVIKGIDLAYDRLLITKQREDSEMIFSRNGRIVKIKARELMK